MSAQQNYAPISDGNIGIGLNEEPQETTSATCMNLPERVLAPFSYLLGFVSGVLVLVFERNSEYVRFHAWQSCILNLFTAFVYFITIFIPFSGALLAWILLIVNIYAIFRATFDASTQYLWKIPMIGALAEKQVYGTNSLPF
ncbi:hypothetical protein BB561_006130 [Smittium simulii]|uniref:DUF4870 domain-containing protein n=1 Tax=Smittium simulii TaxID=133385 RepID=A0A2T9Y6F3_9FUNG|nr:hypothetical protein BB561_006130 [Smittium simulii]